MSKAHKRKPRVGAQPRLPEHVAAWLETFNARVAQIAPGMIHAETERTLSAADANRAAYPGTISEAFHEEVKATMAELVAAQQTSMAEGRAFRELLSDMEPMAMPAYLATQTINPAWLIGFANDEAARRHYEQQARIERAAKVRENMSRLGRRPRKPRNGKWSQSVRDEAVACYSSWYEAGRKNRNTHGGLWGTKWRDFAPICIESIKKKTGVVVTEDQLRRSILPVEKYPRPE